VTSDTGVPRPARRNFVVRFWRGELPLGISYWVFGLLLSLLFTALLRAIATLLRPDQLAPVGLFWSLGAILAAFALVRLWQAVGILRSAAHHAAACRLAGRSTFWARTAQVTIVLFALASVREFAGTAPLLADLYQLAFLDDSDVDDYRVRLVSDTEIEIVGGFRNGLAAEFEEAIRLSPSVRTVHLHSGGGRIAEAGRVARVIETNGLDTYVRRSCSSACVIAFAAGRERWLDPLGRLGFHAPQSARRTGDGDAKVATEMVDRLVVRGFDRAMVERGMKVDNEQMWFPALAELQAGRAITRVAEPGRFTRTKLETPVVAEMKAAIQASSPLYLVMETAAPELWEDVYSYAATAQEDGLSLDEALVGLRTILEPWIAQARLQATDINVAAFARLAAEQLTALLDDPAKCESMIFSDGIDYLRALPRELVVRQAELNARVVRDPPGAQPQLDRVAVDALWEEHDSRLNRRLSGSQYGLLDGRRPSPAERADFCLAYREMFADIAELPESEAAALMRDMWSYQAGN